MNSRDFWNLQTKSLHRSPDIYKKKAKEHISIIKASYRKLPIIDLGCGAGELLEFLIGKLNIEEGIDYSQSMLNMAEKRLGSKVKFKLVEKNIFDFLENSNKKIWLTTGALNQYLNPEEIEKLISTFVFNKNVSTFYLFDCVDPLRYSLMGLGIEYFKKSLDLNKTINLLKSVKKFINFIKLYSSTIKNKGSAYLGKTSMGYGYVPSYWIELANNSGLNINIVSSMYYEYRYHVILTK